MALRGDLASVDLAQVFQMLALNKKVGLLSIQSAKLRKILYFDQRGVTVHHNVHAILDRVVAAFLRSGRLGEQPLEEVRDHAVRMGQALSDSLLAGGYLDPSELEDQYRVELEEEIYDLFFCKEAKFEFHENVTRLEGQEGAIDERFFFNCDSVIMEAARRIDEWAYITERVPSTSEILVATASEVSDEDYGADGPAIFELLDGRHNVARIVELTGVSTFIVCKVLSQLLDAQAIAPVAHEELLALGDECMGEGRLQDAVCLYERAVDLGIGLPETYALAAKAHTASEEYELAINHLENEAEHRIVEGDHEGAAACLFEVKDLIPTDLRARERLVELTLGPDAVKVDGFDALQEGKDLVELLTEFGDIQRVRTLLERLLLVEPNDPDLKKALVNVHVRAGDQKRVVQLYESIADDLVRQNKPLEAVSYLQKILLLDRRRTDISERMRGLYESDERSRSRSRSLSVLAVLFCLLLVAGSGYWFYNERADEEFAAIDVSSMLQHDDFAGANAAFVNFIERHPLTTAVTKAQAELQKVTSAQKLFEARRRSEKATREAGLAKLRDNYRLAWARHRTQFLAGKPELALEELTIVRELLLKTGTSKDMEWALEQQVEHTWSSLVQFLDESTKLGSAYDERLALGDWKGAREVALRLQDDYEHTASGRRVRVPVMIVTRPAGAELFHNGKPLINNEGGEQKNLMTPGLILCNANEPFLLTAVLDGFESREITVNAKAHAQIDAVLAVVPERVINFETPGQTGAGVGGGWLAVGLRGGKIGIARTDGSNRQVRELEGLMALDSDPVIQVGRIFFVSNEHTIECLPVDPGVQVSGWPVRLTNDAATPLAAGNGRLVLVDNKGVMHCWEQATGRRLWGVALNSSASGVPTIVRRKVFVGTADGRVLAFDITDGSSLGVLSSPIGLSTSIQISGSTLFFGGVDGAIRAVDFDAGRVLWTESVGRELTSEELSLASGALIVSMQDRVRAIDTQTGQLLGEMQVDGVVLGIQSQGDRVYVRVQKHRSHLEEARNVLMATTASSCTVLWEYALTGNFTGPLGIDGNVVGLPTPAGEMVFFR